jgi:cation/acetate symporter
VKSIARKLSALPMLASLLLLSSSAHAATAVVSEQFRGLAFSVFGAIIGLTLIITYIAAKRASSAGEFYTAGGGVTGLMNGLAIAGDYLSAAAFLGVSGLVALYGFDGFVYLIGFFVAFVPVLLLIAEPCRNIGKYTLGDILAYRNQFRSSKLVAAVSSIIVAIFYLIPQIVGGAVLIKALIGIEYEVSVVAVGVLMITYVLFGGMRATTWVQIIKAVLLLSACFVLVVLAWAPFGMSFPAFLDTLMNNPVFQTYVAKTLLAKPDMAGLDAAAQFLQPGLYLKNPIELISLGLALILGTAAMPHILMRFFTVANAQVARSSVLWAMLFIGACHIMIVFIGLAAAHYISAPVIASFDKGGNLAAPLLAQYLGGGADSFMGNLLLGFVAAVAFATIVAVVAGLTLAAASALAHDIYVGTIKQGKATEKEQVVAAKLASVVIGIIGISISILAKGQNVAHLVGLAFAVAASANLPALFLTLYWKGCNTTGVVCGVVGGMVTAIVLVLVSPNLQYPLIMKKDANKAIATNNAKLATLEPQLAQAVASNATKDVERLTKEVKAATTARKTAETTLVKVGNETTSIMGLEAPLVDLKNPGIISIPLGFLFVLLGSLLGKAGISGTLWTEMLVRRQTGMGLNAAVDH